MYTLFIIFFISLATIIFLIGRKLKPARSGELIKREHSHPFVPDLQKIKHFSYNSVRKYEHLALVAVVRSHVRFTNFSKRQYEELTIKIKKLRSKNKNGETGDGLPEPEISKFLKIISSYKQKARNIRRKITEEEEMK